MPKKKTAPPTNPAPRGLPTHLYAILIPVLLGIVSKGQSPAPASDLGFDIDLRVADNRTQVDTCALPCPPGATG